MMWARSKSGFTVLEVAVSLTVLGMVLAGLAIVLQVGLRYFVRAQAAQLYHLHVEPLEILLAKQVRDCRFAVYDNLEDARVGSQSGIVPAGNILRADRCDGAGWFILEWSGQDRTLSLITDAGPGLPFTRSIQLWNGLTNLFDTSQGFLTVNCSLPVPPSLISLYGGNVTEVDYVLTAEKNQ